MKSKPLFYAMLASLPFLVAACEPMDAVDPFGVVHDKKSDDKKDGGSSVSGTNATQTATKPKKPSSSSGASSGSSSKPSSGSGGGSWGSWSDERWNYD